MRKIYEDKNCNIMSMHTFVSFELNPMTHWSVFKDRDSKAPKRGSVFIGLMTPDGAIWSRYQRAVLMR